jgi:RNA polymerase sigma-70 factor, ECF subfamily
MVEMENTAAVALRVPESQFESFFRENYSRVYQLLYRLTGQRAEAEDLTVEAFMRYLQQPPAHEEHLAGWICCVATRLGLNALRASKRRARYEETAALYQVIRTPSQSPIEELERASEQSQVRSALRRMNRRSAELLLLHHSGFSYKELAAILNLSPGSIGTLLARAEKEFEKIYRDQGGLHASN